MERYKMIKEVGNGTFGRVWRAMNKQTSELVAIKKMKKKYYSWEECINLREVKSLRKMNHPNIVRLKEVLKEHDILCFVFEYMECNLYQLMKDRVKPFSEAEVKNWCFQVFQGLAYMHQRGYFHRDLKPENLLVSKDIIKIADFGLAREINTKPPYTEYVSTRWYRAPEVLLQSPTYGPAVDMWAMGAIMAELFTLRALFPGSSEADEIFKICTVIGTPTESEWAEGLELARVMGYQFPQCAGGPLSALISSVSKDAVDLLAKLCSWDPCKRPTASEALKHPFFKSCNLPCLRPMSSLAKTPPTAGSRVQIQSERKLVRRLSGTLPDLKPTNNATKPHTSLHAANVTGIQRRLEMTNQEQKHHHKTTLKQPPRCQPPPPNIGPIANYKKTRGISATAENLGKMTISCDEVSKKKPQQQQPPRTKKSPDVCFGRSRQILPERTTTRKVTG